MNAHFINAGGHIIGQMSFATLAGIRAPLFLPESLNSTLFETHLFLWGVLIVCAFILVKVGGARRQRKIMQMGFSVILVTMLWMLAAMLVDTPAERLAEVHRKILTAAQSKDLDGIKACLLPAFKYGPLDRDTMITAVDGSLKTFTIKSNFLKDYTSQVEGNHAITDLTVVSQIDGAAAGTYLTNWKLEWMDDPTSDWQLARINNWKLNGQDMPAEIGFPKAQ